MPVVEDRACRDLFPMHWSTGMVCAGQVGGANCLVRMHVKGQTCARLLWNPTCCLLPPPPGRPRRRDGVWRAAAGRPVVHLGVHSPPGPRHLQQDLPVHPLDEGRDAEPLTHLSPPDHPPSEGDAPPDWAGPSIESNGE